MLMARRLHSALPERVKGSNVMDFPRIARRRASDFRWLVCATVVASVGCNSDTSANGAPWAFGADAGNDVGVDATVADMQGSLDVDAPLDMGRTDANIDVGVDTAPTDTGVDAADAAPADSGPGDGPWTGWISLNADHAGFVDDPDGDFIPQVLGGGCIPYVWAEPPRQNWWVESNAFLPLHSITPASLSAEGISYATIDGQLTPRANSSRLGDYPQTVTVQSIELHSCYTAEVFRHCVRPMRQDICTIPELDRFFPDPDPPEQTLSVTFGGLATSPISFAAQVIYNAELAEGRTDATVTWQLDAQAAPMQFYDASQLDGLSLRKAEHGFALQITEYSDLQGWIAYSDGAADGWYVSISGTDDNGESLHVWGWFMVTDRIALP